MQRDKHFMVVEDIDLNGKQRALYLFRLCLLAITSPLLWSAYRKAKKRTGHSNPHCFVQVVRLRLGHNAQKYQLDPLKPRETAKIIRKFKQE